MNKIENANDIESVLSLTNRPFQVAKVSGKITCSQCFNNNGDIKFFQSSLPPCARNSAPAIYQEASAEESVAYPNTEKFVEKTRRSRVRFFFNAFRGVWICDKTLYI